MLGGVIQGVGYVLLAGCPLALVVRVGQGSRFHLVALVAFAGGAALFGHLRAPIVDAFEPLSLRPKDSSTPDTQPRDERDLTDAITFSLPTVDGGRMSYGPDSGRMQLRLAETDGTLTVTQDPVLLVYTAPPC